VTRRLFSSLGALPLLAAPPSALLTPIDEAGFAKLLAAQKGKVFLADFWATWCEPCRTEMPKIAALHKKLSSRGLVWLTISADEPEDTSLAHDFLRKVGVVGPAYLKQAKSDEKFINAIDPKWSGALPALFLFDRAGNKAASFIGETEIAKIEAAILKLL
jgi:thiol-disulfide isomerase/thioredoxin